VDGEVVLREPSAGGPGHPAPVGFVADDVDEAFRPVVAASGRSWAAVR